MCCPSYAWRLLDLDAQHGFHRTDDHLQKSGHIPMMRAYHVSGGIIIIYKKILSNFLKFIHSDSEFVQWVEILNDISDKSKNVLLGCVYIPPEFSPYSSDEAFLQLEDELILIKDYHIY
jgi:hypothetical protein